MKNDVRFENYKADDADFVIVAFGIIARIAKESVDIARSKGVKAGLVRPITLSPFPYEEINRVSKKAKKLISVEMNMGQMVDDVKIAVEGNAPVSFYGRTGGNFPNEEEIATEIIKLQGGKK